MPAAATAEGRRRQFHGDAPFDVHDGDKRHAVNYMILCSVFSALRCDKSEFYSHFKSAFAVGHHVSRQVVPVALRRDESQFSCIAEELYT